MKLTAFSSRNYKEIIRDPLNLAFGIGFPVVLLLLLTAIQSNIPTKMFPLEALTPGIAVFGLSFLSLFSSILISKDRSSSFLMRLFASPLTAKDFILGYTLPLIPLAILQNLMCFIVAYCLGLSFSIHIIMTIVVLIPTEIFFISLGLLFGTLLNDKQVGGVCGALLTNLSAWLSGTWFDLNLVGGAFKTVADLFPFSHAVNAARAALAGTYGSIFPDLWWVIGYAVGATVLAVFVFSKKMRSDRE